jgi:hypothetical protein
MTNKLMIAVGILIAMSTTAVGQDTPSLNQVTLYSKIVHRNWSRASINFGSGERGAPTGHTSTFDLVYGTIIVNDDGNWFEVGDARSMIVDLGKKKWEDFKTTSFPQSKKRKPLPLSANVKEVDVSAGSKDISPYQQYVRAKAGHMYLLKTVRERKKTYVLFRVETLVSHDNCVLSWKKVSPPPDDIEK